MVLSNITLYSNCQLLIYKVMKRINIDNSILVRLVKNTILDIRQKATRLSNFRYN